MIEKGRQFNSYFSVSNTQANVCLSMISLERCKFTFKEVISTTACLVGVVVIHEAQDRQDKNQLEINNHFIIVIKYSLDFGVQLGVFFGSSFPDEILVSPICY